LSGLQPTLESRTIVIAVVNTTIYLTSTAAYGRKTRLINDLHWLPIVARVRYKILLLVGKSQQGLLV